MAWIDFIVSLLVMQLLGGPLVQKKKFQFSVIQAKVRKW